MSGDFLVGLDLGTQSIRALLADAQGATRAVARRPTPTHRLDDGSAEYDPDALWACVLDLLTELAPQIPRRGKVAGMACASIGESIVLTDAAGTALAPSLAWFDRRTEPDADTVEAALGAERLYRITGYPPDPTLSLPKLLWYRRTRPDAFARTRRVLPISSWIAFRLCGVAAVDPSLAARTLCLDAHARTWSAELLAALDLDPALLPPILPSGTPLGPVLPDVLATTGLPGRPVVAVGAQDHICGGFLAGATRPGVLLDSLGTAEALLAIAETPPLTADTRSLGFVQTAAALDRPFYLVGSGLNASGGSVEWARAAVGAGTPRDDLIAAAAAVPPGSGGVLFLPHLARSTAPTPDPAARGAFVGLTATTDPAALFRAVLEGVALEARLVTDALAALPGVATPADIRVIGGGTRNSLLLTIKASAFARPLTVFDAPEMTAVGAAVLGGLAGGLWPDFDAALTIVDLKRHIVEPDPDWTDRYDAMMIGAYQKLYHALEPINHALTALEAATTCANKGFNASRR